MMMPTENITVTLAMECPKKTWPSDWQWSVSEFLQMKIQHQQLFRSNPPKSVSQNTVDDATKASKKPLQTTRRTLFGSSEDSFEIQDLSQLNKR